MKRLLLILAVVAMMLPSCKKINEALDSLDDRLNKLEQTAIPSINEQIFAIQTSIEALEAIDKSLDESIKALEDSDKATAKEIAALKDADKAIEAKIAELKKYVDEAINSTKDWVNATFATLEQLNALSGEVAALKSLVNANKTEAATNLANAISALETSLKAWVGEQLSNYYTIAEIEAKVLALQNTIASGNTSLQEELNSLKSQLSTTAAEITAAYKKAIEEAITTNNGVINAKIANEIASVNKRITDELATINAKIAEIESRLDNVEAKIAELLARIQSVSYIPEYTDGKVLIERIGSTSWGTLSFRISPKGAVAELAKVWESAVYCEAYYPKTRVVSFVKLAVTEFEGDAENGVITVKVSGEGLSEEFFVGTQEAKIALVISDGNNQVVSDYADVYGREVKIEIVSYKRDWAEQPEYQDDNASLLHKTYYTTLNTGRRVRNFSVCYDTSKICSRWVAYPAHNLYTSPRDYQVGGTTQGRTNAWAFDDAVTQYAYSTNWSTAYEIVSTYVSEIDTYDTYTNPIVPQSKQANIVGSNSFGSGWARGHMLPSADRYNTWNTNAQTYYATNIMAQYYDFNSGSWANLENKVRTKMCSDTLYVVVGTLFENNKTVSRYDRVVSVPSHCFKLLLRTKKGDTGKHISDIKSADELMCIGFIFENTSTAASAELKNSTISVAEIERRSGFSFFRNLDFSIADEVKSQNSPIDWGL